MQSFIKNKLNKTNYFALENELEQLTAIQQVFAETFTFENIDVLLKNDEEIDEQFLIDKLLVNERGGLCYEINGALYLVLKELGFDVTLGSATVWSDPEKRWIIDRTHTVILYYTKKQMYLLDSGSGTNLAIKPLPLDREPIQSPVGIFRLRTENTERGSIVSEKLTEDGWVLRYAFHPVEVNFHEDVNRIKDMIHNHPESPFNKDLLIARTLPDGTVSINSERSSRKWIDADGFVEKEERMEFEHNHHIIQAVEQYGSASTTNAVREYVENQRI